MKLFFDFLPTYQQEIIKKLAAVYQIDTDYVLSTYFAVVAASQGDRFQIIDPKGYINSLSLWLCQIAISGYGKSECASWLMKPLVERDDILHEEFKQLKAKWLSEDPVTRGEAPIEKKFVLNDYTPESLFDAMENAGQDGIILYRDELAGWLKDIGRYGKSGEVEQYLSAWSQQYVRITRLGRDDNLIKRPCFNVFGGLQPDILREMLGKQDLIANGFNARFLFIFSDDNFSTSYFSEKVPDNMKVAYKGLIDRLLKSKPTKIVMSPAAKESFIIFWEDLQIRKTSEANMVRQLISKLQIYVEKWAGIIELLASDGSPMQEISGNSMDIAISHIRVFEDWALKAYSEINPHFAEEPKKTILGKKETLDQLKIHYPNMQKNLVAEGLGINKSLLSR